MRLNAKRWTWLVCIAAMHTCYAADQSKETTENTVSDGPYISATNTELEVQCVIDSQRKTESVSISLNNTKVDDCVYPVNIHQTTFDEQKILEFKTTETIVAVSDFHGQYDLMKKLLTNNGVIDSRGMWALGKGHFVITGDVFDRGDKVTEILWFLYQLDHQAEQAGGKVHLLLGNHEVMVLNGDLRYLHPKYVDVAKILNMPFEQLFSKETILGDWLRSKPVLVKINNMLFAHGGFHPELVERKLTIEKVNRVFKRNLIKAELTKPRVALGEYLHKKNGPIWYRGYFKDNGATSEEIDLLLSHFDIEHLVVGHTSQKQVLTKHQGRVIAIDSSIKRGQYGEILIVEGNEKWRGTLEGKRLSLRSNR